MKIVMFSKRYELTEVDRRTWLRVHSRTHLSTSNDTHQAKQRSFKSWKAMSKKIKKLAEAKRDGVINKKKIKILHMYFQHFRLHGK